MLNSKDVSERFNELNKDNNIICAQKELEDFLLCGLLFKSGRKYMTRNNEIVKVEVLRPKEVDFDIDLGGIIDECNKFAKENNEKKIFYMSERCYNNYKQGNQIINKNNKEYYRCFNNDDWLIKISGMESDS